MLKYLILLFILPLSCFAEKSITEEQAHKVASSVLINNVELYLLKNNQDIAKHNRIIAEERQKELEAKIRAGTIEKQLAAEKDKENEGTLPAASENSDNLPLLGETQSGTSGSNTLRIPVLEKVVGNIGHFTTNGIVQERKKGERAFDFNIIDISDDSAVLEKDSETYTVRIRWGN